MRRGKVLPLVDEDVIGGTAGLLRQVSGRDSRGLGKVEAAVPPALRAGRRDQFPYRRAFRPVEGDTTPGTAYPKVGTFVVDLVGQHDVGVLGGQEGLVGELVRQGGAGRLDDLAPLRAAGACQRRGAWFTKDV